MQGILIGYTWARDAVGETDAAVYHLYGKAGHPDLYLKHGQGALADELNEELKRLRWLASYLAVPAVVEFSCMPDQAWLLTTALSGTTAYQALESNSDARLALVDALVGFMLRLHAIPASECPFNSDSVSRLAHARSRIDSGLIDLEDFDEDRRGWTSEQVWEAMKTLSPFVIDTVTTHGDYSLDNLLMRKGQVVGCIDVGRLGVADRYQDLAILWNCLGEFDQALQNKVFQSYGIADIDWRRLQFHLMLNELF